MASRGSARLLLLGLRRRWLPAVHAEVAEATERTRRTTLQLGLRSPFRRLVERESGEFWGNCSLDSGSARVGRTPGAGAVPPVHTELSLSRSRNRIGVLDSQGSLRVLSQFPPRPPREPRDALYPADQASHPHRKTEGRPDLRSGPLAARCGRRADGKSRMSLSPPRIRTRAHRPDGSFPETHRTSRRPCACAPRSDRA